MDLNRVLSNITVLSNGCFIWNGYKNSSGYGQLTEKGKYWTTHRYVYTCVKGPIDENKIIRHKCHNPACCNIEHLVEGSHRDNYNDSREYHDEINFSRQNGWIVGDMLFGTCREASNFTGISMNSIIKHTRNGVFDILSYREGCYKSRVTPRL